MDCVSSQKFPNKLRMFLFPFLLRSFEMKRHWPKWYWFFCESSPNEESYKYGYKYDLTNGLRLDNPITNLITRQAGPEEVQGSAWQ